MPHLIAALLLLFCLPLSGTDSGIPLRLSAESQSITTAFGCVNILSGEYFETHNDLQLDGPAPLTYRRCYETASVKKVGWKGVNQSIDFPLHACKLSNLLAVNEREGAYLTYSCQTRTVDPVVFGWGYTNFGGGELTGRTHIKNHQLHYPDANTMEVRTGSGAARTYRYALIDPKSQLKLFHLVKEIRPDGHKVHFSYEVAGSDAHLTAIRTTNAAESLTFHSIQLTPDTNGMGYTVSASNGQSVHCQLADRISYHEMRIDVPHRGRHTLWETISTRHLREVSSSHAPICTYEEYPYPEWAYNKPLKMWLHVTKYAGADGRYRAIGYHPHTGSVSYLQAPLGTDQTPITYATFLYQATQTHVYDLFGNPTIYQFGTSKRISSIDRYRVNALTPYSSQKFFWGDSGPLQGNLLARGIADGQGQFFSCIAGTYDNAGNVIREDLYGNLTGQGKVKFSLGNDHRPRDVECCSTSFVYSTDGFNLRLRETHADGQVVHYHYLPGTDRLVAKLTGDASHIMCREFHRYSSDPLLLETITDDGCGLEADDLTGIICRKMIRYTPRNHAPAVGFPSRVVESYLDMATNLEHQLRRLDLHYDTRDLLVQQDVYDANDQWRYSLTFSYIDTAGSVWII